LTKAIMQQCKRGIPRLPDPRRYGTGNHAWYRLPEPAVQDALRKAIAAGAGQEIEAALLAAPSTAEYARLWHSLCNIAHRVGRAAGEAGLTVRIFAIPLVIVTGSRRPAQLTGVLPDVEAIRALFERLGALGATRNFGLSNGLVSEETLAAVTPCEVYDWTAATGNPRRELPPSPVAIDLPGERVHLRFLIGAGVMAPSDASFVETGANIGAWGLQLGRELASQLAQPDVEILAMPRAPVDLLRAAYLGRTATLEAALNLSVSNAVRRFRTASGDPVAVMSAHDDPEIRLSFSSLIDEAASAGFRWPLHPLDDIEAIVRLMTGLFDDCRIDDVRFVTDVLPSRTEQGQIRFLRARDALAQAAARRH
jgi:hypothetical protein